MDTVSAGEAVLEGRPGGRPDQPEQLPLLRHPLPVAILATAFAVLAFATHTLGAGAVIAAVMAAVLIVVSATDLERRIIPNHIVLPATAFVLVVRVVFFPASSLEFILAAVVAGIAFLIPILINSSLMGMGDVKLVVLLGAGLGSGVVSAITIAFAALFPFALATLVRGGLAARKATLPFGPFLAFGGLVILFVPHLAGLA
jgi:leader peptidase (prepilin peptidase)/N-methyltransferase